MTRRISCRACGQSGEGFAVLWTIRVLTDIDAQGEQVAGTDYANDIRGQSIMCRSCGHGWRTTRYFDLTVNVE